MLKLELEIINKLGLHARASAKLTQAAGRFKSDIFISKAGKRVNAKSIMGVMMLAAGKGSSITIDCVGERADEALAAMLAMIADKFGEGE